MKWLWIGLSLLTLNVLKAQEALPQKEPEIKTLKEYVSVTNVELVLRVIRDGVTVGGFKKGDFRLLENGKEYPINGFFELKKKMRPTPLDALQTEPVNRRLFLLFFWATQEKTLIKPHLDAFFAQIYQPFDRVILASNNASFDIQSPTEIESQRRLFEAKLSEEVTRELSRWRALHRDLNFEMDQMISLIRLNKDGGEVFRCLSDFKKKYSSFIKEIEFLTRNVDYSLINQMSDNLSQVNIPKWALVFFENNRVPMIDLVNLKGEIEKVIIVDDDGSMLSRWYKEMTEIEIALAQQGRQTHITENLRSRLIQADTVFHTISLHSPTTSTVKMADYNELLYFKPIPTIWESVLKSISQATGGQISSVEDDPSKLTPLFEQEDISYLITYVPPKQGVGNRKIKIVMSQAPKNAKKDHLIYGKRIEIDETPAVRIDQLYSEKESLRLFCSHFYPINTDQGPKGHLRVTLVGKTEKSEPTPLLSEEYETSGQLTLPVKLPHDGKWTLSVTVTDLMTQQSDTKRHPLEKLTPLEVQVHQREPETSPLVILLNQSALYSERLKKTALRFFCQESVTQKIGSLSTTLRRNRWKYDYQIVLNNGKMTETRTKKGKKDKEMELETVYKSLYSFFLPVTFLARERQLEYQYALLEYDRIKGRTMARISAKPRIPGSGLPAGELWLNETDGSVWQIKLDPTTLPGFSPRYELAQRKGLSAVITDTHQYHVQFNGLQFPSNTFISEYQHLNKVPTAVSSLPRPIHSDTLTPSFYSVEFSYSDYRFFDVESNERITGWVEE